MKRVSVILTTYNGEKVIERTIASILNQQGVDEIFELELIVVDDVSTDKTFNLLKTFSCQLFSTGKNSGGPNKGRNIGLDQATGDYICIADQDDVWESDKIVSLLPFLKQVPIVTSGYTVRNSTSGKEMIRVGQSNTGHLHFKTNETFMTHLTRSWSGQNVYLGSVIYRKELQHIRFEETFGAVDFDWYVRLFHNRDSIEVCRSLYFRMLEGDNLSLNEEYRKKDFYYSLMFIENYSEDYPRAVLKAYRRLHGSRARYYYMINNMPKARFYFKKSERNFKTILYFLSTFIGSSFIKKKFNIFG